MPKSKNKRVKKVKKKNKEIDLNVVDHYFKLFIKMLDKRIKANAFKDGKELSEWMTAKAKKYLASTNKEQHPSILRALEDVGSYLEKLTQDYKNG